MEVIYDYKNIKHIKEPIILTIGTFDGLHLGHQEIFKTLKDQAIKKNGSIAVITFSNHPLEVIHSDTTVPSIISLEEKLELFRSMDVDLVIVLEFTKKLQEVPYDVFVHDIRKHLPFNCLVLGKGSAFGKQKEGNESHITSLGKKEGFEAIYLEKILYEDAPISSKIIREKLKNGDVEGTKHLLGRPYSLYAPFHVETLQEIGEHRLKITFDFKNHCVIPSGYYVIQLRTDEHSAIAVAYLTTLSSDKTSKTFDLDIYIKTETSPFMNDKVKIEFLRKINSSKSFDDLIESSDKIQTINFQ